ncbi:hypothetical protein DFA_02350 [Cavenderia fasciculata]|uniref:25S rRNA (uridine-N(3))-methyltransferase BMT5-like domain-containing protein n=1 Tax=Cavenderia fasciculata TaxID=261658 RepID=F4PZ75_CACFS|nr:uncharacterized protein DFA_02350 [Cavenderia fasciculata]EGG19104.1 hypothetical protein DFA_02350 [Cavenderia fasciculata]|eukprot:XP_004366737.1 hypothetical protein DFA_02350 [Cavenderia fasciculata]
MNEKESFEKKVATGSPIASKVKDLHCSTEGRIGEGLEQEESKSSFSGGTSTSIISTMCGDKRVEFFFNEQKKSLVAKVGKDGEVGKVDQVEFTVVLPPIRNQNHVALSQACRLRMLLRNRLVKPLIDKTNKTITFGTGRQVESWKILSTYEILNPENPPAGISSDCYLVRSNGTISFGVGNTVKTLDIHNDTWSIQSFQTNQITAMAESPDGLLIVGDDNGVIHIPEKGISIALEGPVQRITFKNPNEVLVKQENIISLISLKPMKLTGHVEANEFFCLGNGQIIIQKDKTLHKVDKEFKLEKAFEENVDGVLYGHDSSLLVLKGKKTFILSYNGETISSFGWIDKWEDRAISIHLKSIDNNRVAYREFKEKSVMRISGEKSTWTHNPKKHKEWFINCSTILSDGSIIYATNQQGAGIHHIQYIQLDKMTSSSAQEYSIRILEETVDGLVIGFNYGGGIVIFEPDIEAWDPNIDNNFKKDQLNLQLKYDPTQLHLYDELVALQGNSPDKYLVFMRGMEAAIKLNKIYKARRFYEKAKNVLPLFKQEAAERFYQHLKSTPYKQQRRVVALELYALTKEEKYLKEFNSTYKSRLIIGEGNFSYTKSLLEEHSQLEGLAKSIIATELIKKSELKNKIILGTIEELEKKGVNIMFEVDGQVIGKRFTDQKYKRIQWNCPFGGTSGTAREDFKKVVPKFFQSASQLQNVGDRIHIALDQSKSYWKERKNYVYIERQTDNPIVKGSIKAKYKLIRKRRFGKRYPNYEHKMTDQDGSSLKPSVIREFVFEKVDHDIPSIQDGEIDKNYVINGIVTDQKNIEHYGNAYFDCSTDDDSSDYCDSD